MNLPRKPNYSMSEPKQNQRQGSFGRQRFGLSKFIVDRLKFFFFCFDSSLLFYVFSVALSFVDILCMRLSMLRPVLK